jgi:hemerythrin
MEHVDFLERLSAFHIHWLKSAIDRSMAQEVETRLAEWIATHIQLVDSKLRESLGTQAE